MNGIAHTAGQLKKMKNSHPQVQYVQQVQQVRRDPAFGGMAVRFYVRTGTLLPPEAGSVQASPVPTKLTFARCGFGSRRDSPRGCPPLGSDQGTSPVPTSKSAYHVGAGVEPISVPKI